MCRFLLAKSDKPFDPSSLLKSFSVMAEKSRAFDGDWQGDGWGFSWLDMNNLWKNYTSLSPIWKEIPLARQIENTKILLIHARSASFPQHKGILEYNQPYILEPYSYVFNGYLKGVTIPLPGKIGAQKIWFLLQNQLSKNSPELALEKTKNILLKNTRDVQALNIGFSDKKNIYALCHYSKHEKYYQLHQSSQNSIYMICSEPLPEYPSNPISSNQIIKL